MRTSIININNKKILKSDFYNKSKKIFNICDIDIIKILVSKKELLKRYSKIWKKMKKIMKIDFDTKTTYGDGDDKYIKTRIKTYKDSMTTNFYNKNGSKKIPEKSTA